MAEFTGERVIPGQVDVDLLNEHLARYTFAARLARGKRVLDAGCGAGYGSAELAQSADSVVGIDCAAEAVEFARANYRLPNLRFEQASCTGLPHPDRSFDLVVAFEVIEHLEDWRAFLFEVRRVLATNGQFIVSTPNKLYYTESRGGKGTNPFHVHEFDFAEFRSELKSIFPYVSMFLENHVEGVTFQPEDPGNTVEVRVDPGEPNPDDSHFFVAVCAHRPQLGNPTFVYVPRAGNVLRERERHIELLERELAAKNEWLRKALDEHQDLMAKFHQQKESLEKSNRWAESLTRELEARSARIAELQEEFAREQDAARKVADDYAAKVLELEEDIRAKTKWARDVEARLTAEVQKQTAHLVAAVEALHHTEKELEELHRVGTWFAGAGQRTNPADGAGAGLAVDEDGPQDRSGASLAPRLTCERRTNVAFLKRFLRSFPLLVLSPVLMVISVVALALTDLLWKCVGKALSPAKEESPKLAGESACPTCASVVIPNWNGRDLLEKYLPSVIAALRGDPANEIIVVDNGSTDGSAGLVEKTFPEVPVLALPANLGFGGGSNAGFNAAKNDIVVLLNSDMRVARDFLAPLLEGFRDPEVFAVSCQIFFSDPNKVREETGLTQAWWQDGGLRVRHRIDPQIDELYPCFYGGGGSCAFDRRKFLELGGFDRLLEPFYLEDTDLGFMAWKRGWKVLYQPNSKVWHEHRGTIGKRFREEQIQAALKKNFVLWCWKNIHEWPRLTSHFFFSYAGAILSVMFGDVPMRANLATLWRAFRQLPRADGLTMARPQPREGERCGSLRAPVGRVLSRPLRTDGAGA